MTNYINMKDLTEEINAWGVEARLVFDEDGDGWTILAGFSKHTQGNELMLHRGFEHNGEIYANVDHLTVESNETSMKEATRSWLIVNARMGWITKNKLVKIPPG